MTTTGYNFKKCKLCCGVKARPHFLLEPGIIYRCADCDFHFLDHLDGPTIASNSTIINDDIRAYIDRRSDHSLQFHPQRIDLLKQHTSIDGAKCLDIGAGTGQFQILLDSLGAETLGIEPSAIRRAYAHEKHQLKLHPETVENSYWQDNYQNFFDIVTLWDVIEHVDFPKETLFLATRLVKPGGILALDTPDRSAPSYRISEKLYRLSKGKLELYLSNFYSKAPYGHKQIFTRKQMLGLCREAGLEIVDQTDGYTPAGVPKGKKIILIARKAGR